MSMIRRLLALDGVNVVCHFRDDGQADIVGDAAQSLEEGLVAGLAVDGADKAAVNLQVIPVSYTHLDVYKRQMLAK